MKNHLILAVLIMIPLSCAGQERTGISEDLFYTEIQDSVFLITHIFPQFGSNCLFVLLPGNQGVLIDTPNETSGTRSLCEWIRNEFGDVQLTVINTGWHQDNLGGNEYLLSQKIPVYGPDLTATLISENKEALKELILQNTVVYLHSKKILFGGCMILSMRHQRPGFTGHANMDEWPLSVEKVMQRFPRPHLVIPGHGPPGEASLLNHTVDILNRYNEENPH